MEVLLSTGIVLILAGLIGGKIEAFGVKIPTITKKGVRIVIVVLGVTGIALFSYNKILNFIGEKIINESLSIHKNYSLGISSVELSGPETSAITWIKIDNVKKYTTGLWSMSYLSPPGPGFVVFHTRGNKLFGLWKDIDNRNIPLPGLIELEFRNDFDGNKIASGWWSYEGGIKYYCYLKEEK